MSRNAVLKMTDIAVVSMNVIMFGGSEKRDVPPINYGNKEGVGRGYDVCAT